ncbi:hypothetical protein ACLQ2P_03995 [Actinomadura citrea]|uniref:hypothetical protein n=1 Tax=Actinomadura citrea TaxID=46158 RepID=UPI003CE52AD2
MPRPRRLEVEHTGLDGVRAVTVFTDAVARLVDHEADHLYGPIYAALCARASGRSASPSTRAPWAARCLSCGVLSGESLPRDVKVGAESAGAQLGERRSYL